MKKIISLFLAFIALSMIASATLTNESVLKMVEAGLEDDTIISVIQKDECEFDMSVDGLIALKTAGVSESIIQAMVSAGESTEEAASSAPAPTAQPVVAPVSSSRSSDDGIDPSQVYGVAPRFIAPQPGNTYYTRYTFYFERGAFRITNYRRGMMVPINSEVTLVSIGPNEFLIQYKGQTIKVVNNVKHSGMTSEEVASLMLSDVRTPIEKFGTRRAADIRNGTLRLGMTKEQAIMARGYPPVHETASTEMDRWVYWSSRFVKRTILFYDGILSEGRGLN